MSFVKSVQQSRVRHPTQRNFSLQQWRTAFENSHDGSDSACALFPAGEWTFGYLERVREQLNALRELGADKDEALRIFTGLTNFLVQRAIGIGAKTALTSEPFVVGIGGVEIDASIETILDGMRYPLAMVLQGGQDLTRRPANDREALSNCLLVVRVANRSRWRWSPRCASRPGH